jgi:BRCT domain type II-containing protein
MARVNEKTDMWTVIEVMEVSNALKGKVFSITGHLGRPRPVIVKIIETAGGRFEAEPKWGVNFLITNRDWNKGSTKEAKRSNKLIAAESMKIKIISEDDFCQMIIDNGETAADGVGVKLV